MKRFTGSSFLLTALCFILPVSTPLRAQEWSAAQKDVWKNVEAYTALNTQRNLEGFLEYFHADYCGWAYEDALPSDKASIRKYIEYRWKTTKILFSEIKPVAIKIYGNVAIVHYYYTTVYADAEGKEKSASGRWTDILMKQGDKWVMIGDHGGQTSKD